MFKNLKQLREVTAAMPAVLTEVNALRGAALSYQAATPAAMAVATLRDDDPRLAPIAGVDLLTYIRISKAAGRTGQLADDAASQHGISSEAWQQAAAGWPGRMHGDMALAVHYGNLYRSVA